jgi:hypothetical protein
MPQHETVAARAAPLVGEPELATTHRRGAEHKSTFDPLSEGQPFHAHRFPSGVPNIVQSRHVTRSHLDESQ